LKAKYEKGAKKQDEYYSKSKEYVQEV